MSKNHPLSGFRSADCKSSPAPVLITESRQAYKRLRRDVKKEIAPQGAIERMYLADISQLQWEIRRWRRAKVALLNAAFRDVLPNFLAKLMCDPAEELWEFRDRAEELAFAWFSDQDVQQRVAQRLEEFGLDATAIEASVLKHCRSELNDFERLLASAEARRLKAVRALAEFRSSLRRHITSGSTSDVTNGSKSHRDDKDAA